MDSPEQKFFVSDDGKEKLSITKAELQAGIDMGKYGEKTLAWTKGMSGWLPLSDPCWEKHGIVIPTKLSASEIENERMDSARGIESLTTRYFEDGLKKSIRYFEDGQKRLKRCYKDGKRHGLSTEWNKDGQKRVEEQFEDGEWQSRTIYENGKKHVQHLAKGDFNVIFFHENGSKACEYYYGEQGYHGKDNKYYPDGRLERQQNWVNGTKQGLYTSWHPNGEKREQGKYVDDKKLGPWVSWNENGKIIKKQKFLTKEEEERKNAFSGVLVTLTFIGLPFVGFFLARFQPGIFAAVALAIHVIITFAVPIGSRASQNRKSNEVFFFNMLWCLIWVGIVWLASLK